MNETTMAGHDHVVQVSLLQRNVPVLDDRLQAMIVVLRALVLREKVVPMSRARDEVRERSHPHPSCLVSTMNIPYLITPRMDNEKEDSSPPCGNGEKQRVSVSRLTPGIACTTNMSLLTCGADSLNHMHFAPTQPAALSGQTPLFGHTVPPGHRSWFWGLHLTCGGGGAESRPVWPLACCVVLYRSGREESSQVPT